MPIMGSGCSCYHPMTSQKLTKHMQHVSTSGSVQVWCTDIYLAEACILHTAGAKRHFYDTLIPRWKANETNIHPDPKPVKA